MNALAVLAGSWLVFLAGGLVWGAIAGHGTNLAMAGRLGSSLVLVFAGLYARLRRPNDSLVRCVALGIAFGMLGDFCNAGLVVSEELSTLAAMVAFGIGHLFYIAGLITVLRARDFQWWRSGAVRMSVASWWAVGALGWWVIVAKGANEALSALVWPALGYTLLLSATAGVSMAAALGDRSLRMLALGAALFLLSDLVLAVEIFRGAFPQDTLVVWVLYGTGQALIVFTAATRSIRVLADPAAA